MCALVRDCAVRRRGIETASALIDQLYLDETDERVLASAERVTQVLSDSQRRNLKARTVDDVIEDAGGINRFLAPEMRPGIALPDRFESIQRTLGGLRRGKLILLAARPAVGKSVWVHEVLLHAAEAKKRGLLVTLEMSAEDVLYRELAALARVSSYRFREGRLGVPERERLLEQATWLSSLGSYLRFLDQGIASVPGISNVLRSLAAKGEPVDLLVVDYLQLVQPTGESENRVQEVTKISRGLKTISQAFNIPVLAICNLSRKGMRPTDEPQLDWLRDSGQLEFDADQILFLWPEKEPSELEEERSVAWRVAKNKDGQENRGTLRFHLKHCRFLEEGEKVGGFTYPANGQLGAHI
jgi:replicative DNA helicase